MGGFGGSQQNSVASANAGTSTSSFNQPGFGPGFNGGYNPGFNGGYNPGFNGGFGGPGFGGGQGFQSSQSNANAGTQTSSVQGWTDVKSQYIRE